MAIASELAGTAVKRSNLYGLLATIFHNEPTAALIAELREPALCTALSETGVDLGEDFLAAPEDRLLEDLAVEYARLFLGPGKHIAPHESVQLDGGKGGLWGAETVAVKLFMEEAGFDFDEAWRGIPDHVSVELEFLGKLTQQEYRCWDRGDMMEATVCLNWQHSFLSRHLGKWVPGFCRGIRETAENQFYLAFADLLESFVAGEKAEIETRLKQAA